MFVWQCGGTEFEHVPPVWDLNPAVIWSLGFSVCTVVVFQSVVRFLLHSDVYLPNVRNEKTTTDVT